MPRTVLMTVATAPREEGAIQVELTLPVHQRRREIRAQPSSTSRPGSRPRIPRITRLMALAIKFQDMINRGEVRDYADLARLGYVTRARVTQIMNLLMLAPDIQEHLLSSDEAILGVRERFLRGLCAQIPWTTQRHQWKALLAAASSPKDRTPPSRSSR